METEPDFEDDKLRSWKADRNTHVERDPARLDVDLEREEIYESRTYALEPVAAYGLLQLARTLDPAGGFDDIAWEFIEDGAVLKLLAKQDRSDKRISAIVIGTVVGDRTLLDRWEGIEEEEFRARVKRIELAMVAPGRFQPPLVVTLDQWRAYETQHRPEPGSA